MDKTAFDLKNSIPNKFLQEDGTVTDILGNTVTDATLAYNNKPAIPNKVLNSDGSYSSLTDIISGGGDLEEKVTALEKTVDSNKKDIDAKIIELTDKAGNKIVLEIDDKTYILTVKLLNQNKEELNTATIDLPLEAMIINMEYSNGIITITLQNGETREIPLSDLIKGLVNEKTYNEEQTKQNEEITKLQEENEMLKNLLPTVKEKGTDVILKNTGEMPFKKFEIGGNSYQFTQEQGKNILDLTKLSQVYINPKGKVDSRSTNEITLSMTEQLAENAQSNFIYRLGTFPEGTYYFKGKIEILEGTDINKKIVANVIMENYILKGQLISNGKESDTINLTEETALNIAFYIKQDGDTDNSVRKVRFYDLQISKEDVEYEPFKPAMPSLEYPSEIKAVGDNGSANIKVNNGNVAKINETNWELTENDTIKNLKRNHGAVLTEFNLKAGQKVTIKFKPIQNPTASTMFSFNVNGTTDNSLSFFNIQNYNLNQIYSREYTATEDCTIKYIMWNNDNSDIFEFQFWASIDNELEEYIPHKEQDISVPVQQPMLEGDYFDLARGKEVHIWEKIAFNGTTENWKKSGNGYDTYYVTHKIVAKNPLATNIKSNYFKSYNSVWNKDVVGVDIANIKVEQNNSDIRFCLGLKSTIKTVEEWKAKVKEWYDSGNQLYVWVKLATPTELDLTPEQKTALREQLNSYEGTTYIFSEDEVSPIFDVEAYVKEVNVIEQIEQQIKETDQLKKELAKTKIWAGLIYDKDELSEYTSAPIIEYEGRPHCIQCYGSSMDITTANIEKTLKEKTQYTVSFDYFKTDSSGGLTVLFLYEDNTQSKKSFYQTYGVWKNANITSEKGKTVTRINFNNQGNGVKENYLDLDSIKIYETPAGEIQADEVSSEAPSYDE